VQCGVIVARSGRKAKGPELEGEGKWSVCIVQRWLWGIAVAREESS
jgi:hypothetical protein